LREHTFTYLLTILSSYGQQATRCDAIFSVGKFYNPVNRDKT